MTIGVYTTTIYVPADDGVDSDELEVRAQIAIVGYESFEPEAPDCPASGGDAQIEIRDTAGRPRPDWQDALSREQIDELARDAVRSADREYAEAAADAELARRDALATGSAA